MRVEHHPGNPRHHTRASRHAVHDLTFVDLDDLDCVPAGIRRHVGSAAVEQERLLQPEDLVDQRLTLGEHRRELARVVDRLEEFVAS